MWGEISRKAALRGVKGGKKNAFPLRKLAIGEELRV
jgi:hypothetical protein